MKNRPKFETASDCSAWLKQNYPNAVEISESSKTVNIKEPVGKTALAAIDRLCKLRNFHIM